MARFSDSRGRGAPFDRDARIDRLRRRAARARRVVGERRRTARQSVSSTPPPSARLSQQIRARAGASASAIYDGWRRGWSTCRAIAASRGRARAAAPTIRKGVARATVLAARDALVRRAQRIPASMPMPISRRCCSRAHGRRRAATSAEGGARARSTSSTCCCSARDLAARRPAVRAASPARFTHIFVDEFQDTDPLQAEILLLLRPTIRGDATGARHARCPASCSSSAIRSSRFIASGEPTSASIAKCASGSSGGGCA